LGGHEEGAAGFRNFINCNPSAFFRAAMVVIAARSLFAGPHFDIPRLFETKLPDPSVYGDSNPEFQ
jgi:hypothetical protein